MEKQSVVKKLHSWCLERSCFGHRTSDGMPPARTGGYNLSLEDAISGKFGHGQDLPLTEEAIALHLKGDATLGIYFLHSDKDGVCWCKTIAWDIDDEDADDTKTHLILERLECYGFDAFATKNGEWSRHVWLVLSEPILAELAYAFGKLISAGLEVESYPKQPKKEHGAYGNGLKLPGYHQTTKVKAKWWDGTDWNSDLLSGIEEYEFQDGSKIEPGPWVFDFVNSPHTPVIVDQTALNSNLKLAEDFCNKYHIDYVVKGIKHIGEQPYCHVNCVCPFSENHSDGKVTINDAFMMIFPNRVAYHCSHSHCKQVGWVDLVQKYEPIIMHKTEEKVKDGVKIDWIGKTKQLADESYPIEIELPVGVYALYRHFAEKMSRPSNALLSTFYTIAAIHGTKTTIPIGTKDYSGVIRCIDLTTSGQSKSPDIEFLAAELTRWRIVHKKMGSATFSSFCDIYATKIQNVKDELMYCASVISANSQMVGKPPSNLVLDEVQGFLDSMTAYKMPTNTLPNFCALMDDSTDVTYHTVKHGHLLIPRPRMNLFSSTVLGTYCNYERNETVLSSGAAGRFLPVNSFNLEISVEGKIVKSVEDDTENMISQLLCFPECEITDLPFDGGPKKSTEEVDIQNSVADEYPLFQRYCETSDSDIVNIFLPKAAVQCKKLCALAAIGEAAMKSGLKLETGKINLSAKKYYKQFFSLTMMSHLATFDFWSDSTLKNRDRLIHYLKSHKDPDDCDFSELTEKVRLCSNRYSDQQKTMKQLLGELQETSEVVKTIKPNKLGYYYVYCPKKQKHQKSIEFLTPSVEKELADKTVDYLNATRIWRLIPAIKTYPTAVRVCQSLADNGRWNQTTVERERGKTEVRITPKQNVKEFQNGNA